MNFNITRLYLSFILLLTISTSFGQGNNSFRLPILTPQTPNAYAFQKAGEIPINFNTGYINYGIDLYEVDLGAIKIPIRLQYQNNGLKVNEIPTWVGHGWNLEFGGVITYNQRGKNDITGMLLPGVYAQYQQFLTGQMTTAQQRDYLRNAFERLIDTEFDNYQFNFLGRSGEFSFRPDGSIHTSLDQGLIIEKTSGGFKITDETGNQFFFESQEANSILTNCGDPTNPDYNDNSSYFLTRIQTINNRSAVYQYRSYPLTYNQLGHVYYHRIMNQASECPPSILSQTCSSILLNNLLVESITFDNGEVLFEHTSSARLDVKQIDATTTLPSLQAITIKNSGGSVFSKYNFDYEYFGINQRLKLKKIRRTNGTLQAHEHSFSYINENGSYPHFFSNAQDHAGYYNGGGGPYLFPKTDYSFLPAWNTSLFLADRSSNFDYGKFGLLEKITYPTGGSTTFTYEPNQLQFKSYKTLKLKSFYFDLPVNRIFDGTNVHMYDAVHSTPVSGSFTLTTETFVQITASKQYDQQALANPEINLSGPPATVASINTFLNNLQLYCSGALCQNSITMVMEPGTYSYTMTSGQNSNGSPLSMTFKVEEENNKPFEVGGGRIKKIVNNSGTDTDQIMEKEIIYDHNEDSVCLKLKPIYHTQADTRVLVESVTLPCTNEIILNENPINPSGINILYNRVTELAKGPVNIGTIVHRYQPNLVAPVSTNPFIEVQNLNWRYGEIQLLKYRNTSTSAPPIYALSENTFFNSSPTNSVQYNTGFRLSLSQYTYGNIEANQYIVVGNSYTTERFYLRQQDVFLHNGSQFIKNTTINSISPNHNFIAAVQTNTSTDNQAINRNAFSFDFNTNGATTDDAMGIKLLKDNNINAPIESVSIKKIGGIDYVVAAKLFTYKSNKPVLDKTYSLKIAEPLLLSAFTPAIISSGTLIKDTRYVERLAMTSYDEFNNPLEMKKSNNMTLSYLWDYSKMYIVAECSNTDASSVAFTSFETNNHNGWTVGGSSNTTYKLTGNQSYLLSNGDVSRSGLTSRPYVSPIGQEVAVLLSTVPVLRSLANLLMAGRTTNIL